MSLSALSPFDDLDSGFPNAVAATLADRLGEHEDPAWVAFARSQHDDSQDPRVAAAIELLGQCSPGEAGSIEALEDVLFDLASSAPDPGWYALSAWVASRQTEPRFEDLAIREFAQAALRDSPEVALTHALWVQVLLNLGDEDGASEAFRAALSAHEDHPRWLWALLRVAAVDTDLPELCDAAYARVTKGFESDPRLLQVIETHREAVVSAVQDRDHAVHLPASTPNKQRLAVSVLGTAAAIAMGGGVDALADFVGSEGADARTAAKMGTTEAGVREAKRWIGIGTIPLADVLRPL